MTLRVRSGTHNKVNPEDEIVILFFSVMLSLIKNTSERQNKWRSIVFKNSVAKLIKSGSMVAARMSEELLFCEKRRRSRRYYYNVSAMDQVLNEYYISGFSENTLSNAWSLFNSGRYMI